MKIRDARAILPPFARALCPQAITTPALRDAVVEELMTWHEGENPLSKEQVAQFEWWLQKTQ